MRRFTCRSLVVLVACHLAVCDALAERVVRVKDGDSIVVLSGDNEVDVRIADIDAPELDQSHGEAAKIALHDLVAGRDVRLELIGGDVYRRIIADVYVGDVDVAAALVRDGHAWVRRAYTSAAGLIGLEEAAQSARRGLWAEAKPVPPWIWRMRGKGGAAPLVVECGSKRHCSEMHSCEEAVAYLQTCGLSTIDGDGDGIPCESLCRYYR